MAFLKLCALVTFVCLANGAPQSKPAFWKGTPMDSVVEKMRSSCDENDSIACFQYKAFEFLNSILNKEYLKPLMGNVEVTPNTYQNEVTSRSYGDSMEDAVEAYIKSHDVTFKLPIVGDLTVDARSLDSEELDFKLRMNTGRAVEARKKSKLKKIFIPLLVFLLLKAITIVPFALGVLGWKAWNGLQLSFFSFIITAGLAIFQLCQKIAADNAHPAVIASPPTAWEAQQYARRSFDGAQEMAYSAHAR